MGENFAIDVRGMTKRFGSLVAVDHIDLQVRAGEICGFLGPNGSGKTTFIRMLCGLLRADEGSGSCLGFDVITESEAIKRQVGYMTQRFSFYEDLSIAENLDFVARMYAIPDRREAVRGASSGSGWPTRRNQLAGAALRRLEAAPGPGRLPDPRAETAPARRAHRRRGPEGPPRVLGGDPPPRRARA